MAAKVVDASAVVALLFGEAEGPGIAERLRGADLIAPALLPFELANVCLKKIRRHPAQGDAIRTSFRMFDRMAVSVIEVDQGQALALAESSGLTAYDASYLWLARRMGSELVTLDRQLAAAAVL